MKTYCKRVDPTDIETILPFVWGALDGKLRRKDYSAFVSGYCEFSPRQIRRMAREHELYDEQGKCRLDGAVLAIAKDVAARIERRKLDLPPVRYENRKDGMSEKTREIGIEAIIQQVIEHVAVGCLNELWQKKLCPHQYASIKGKGQVKGAKAIRRWTKEDIRKTVKGQARTRPTILLSWTSSNASRLSSTKLSCGFFAGISGRTKRCFGWLRPCWRTMETA